MDSGSELVGEGNAVAGSQRLDGATPVEPVPRRLVVVGRPHLRRQLGGPPQCLARDHERELIDDSTLTPRAYASHPPPATVVPAMVRWGQHLV